MRKSRRDFSPSYQSINQPINQSIDFNSAVDSGNEEVSCIKADCARQNPHGYDHEQCVAKVEERRNEAADF